MYALDDAADEIIDASIKNASNASNINGGVGLGFLVNSVSTGLTIREMLYHNNKKNLPSKLIREFILVLENQTLDELKDQCEVKNGK
jgi:hypothetical protein